VRRNGQGVAPELLGSAMPTDPGDVAIDVEAPGRQLRSYRVHLDERATVTIELAIGVPVPPPRPQARMVLVTEHDRVDRPRSRRPLAWGFGAAGIASVATGFVLGALALDRASTMNDHCDANLACDPQGLDAAKSGEVLAPLSTITILAGVALLGTGLFFSRSE
jgi:hypothetical protein